MRTKLGKVFAGALAAAAALVFASQADAGWRWHGSSGGGWGSSGGYGSSGGWGGSSGGWGGSSGGWGGSSGGGGGGWHHAKRHRHHGWGGSSGGWGGSSGGWGGSSGGWGGSSGGSYGGAYYGGGYDAYPAYPVDPSLTVPMQPAPGVPAPGYAPAPGGTLPAPGAPAPGTGGAPAPAETSIRRADGLLAVNVPDDAKVFVNGQPTTSTGGSRQYVSRDLAPGYNYTYEVRAEVTRDGRTLEQVKTVNVRAGDTASLAFDFPQSRSLETSLTLHVPADAKVYLAGNPTKATGEKRIFRTTSLSGADGWDRYTVRVELERGGRTLTKEETIRLQAGDSQELSFDFDGDKVASR